LINPCNAATTPANACYLGDCDSLGYYETSTLHRAYGYSAPTYGYAATAYGYLAPTYGYAGPVYGYSAPTYGYAEPVYGYSAPINSYAYPRYYGVRHYHAPVRYYGPRSGSYRPARVTGYRMR
jgi:hypothetical protein